MRTSSGKILVQVNLGQKGKVFIGGIEFQTMLNYNTNYRERSPVVALVKEGNQRIPTGSYIICHHNRFHEHSVYHLYDDLFAIPVNDSIFMRIDENGDPHSVQGNLVCERIERRESFMDTPESLKKNYTDRVRVLNKGYGFKKGDEIYTYKFSDYEIVYNWNGQIRRVIKVKKEDVVAIYKNIL